MSRDTQKGAWLSTGQAHAVLAAVTRGSPVDRLGVGLLVPKGPLELLGQRNQ